MLQFLEVLQVGVNPNPQLLGLVVSIWSPGQSQIDRLTVTGDEGEGLGVQWPLTPHSHLPFHPQREQSSLQMLNAKSTIETVPVYEALQQELSAVAIQLGELDHQLRQYHLVPPVLPHAQTVVPVPAGFPTLPTVSSGPAIITFQTRLPAGGVKSIGKWNTAPALGNWRCGHWPEGRHCLGRGVLQQGPGKGTKSWPVL